MPWYKNQKPSTLGLNFTAEQGGPRLVGPGEVFEADKDSIPKTYVELNWIVETPKPADAGKPQLPAEPGSLQQPVPDQKIEPPRAEGAERGDKPALPPPPLHTETETEHDTRRRR